ncbi:MAG: phosphoribosylanthranilate isomerase [Actinomycetota bacterium]|nr:phosphoribosylanthranilate isomerase [Actinomycetota bacterium]
MFVKVCGVTRPADAVAAIDAGADALGLNFVPSSRRRIDVAAARAIVAVVPDHVMTVGVFRDQPVDEVLAITGELGLDAAQLHGDEPPEATAAVAAGVGTVIKAVAAGTPAADAVGDHAADIVLLDAPEPGGGITFDWGLVGDLVARHDVLLAGGLAPDNVGDAVRRVRPWGVDVASGVESAPGCKDASLMARFVSEAHAATHRASTA